MRATGTIVIGAGQAGLALSRYLTEAGHEHVLLERGRIGERWRSERWSSLTLLTPNWLNRLPGSAPHADRDGFLERQEFVDYLDAYAASFAAPVEEGTSVLSVQQAPGGFRVETDRGTWHGSEVVIATGDCDVPYLPSASLSAPADVLQLHASRYRSPAAVAPGGVLVVGAGPTGQQLALELARAGTSVVLAVGRHARAPRRYRGRDIFDWLAATGDLDTTIDEVADPAAAKRTPSIPLTGAGGGQQLDLAVLQAAGVALTGRLLGFSGRHAILADDLAASAQAADRRMRRVLAKLDRFIERGGDAPAAMQLAEITAPPPPRVLDLRTAGIGTVLWATGYRRAYPWLRVPGALEDGEVVHRHGITPVPGLYVLGLRFQRRRSSHFIGGVGDDAAAIAEHVLARAPGPGRRPVRSPGRGHAGVAPRSVSSARARVRSAVASPSV
jgi:putative flavoprotein involved in K+ transport